MGKNKKPENENTSHIVISMALDPIVIQKWNDKIKASGLTKREYIRHMILKDVGLTYVPGRYVEAENL